MRSRALSAFNPWSVPDASVFLKYCCPECDFQDLKLDGFKSHAVKTHSLSHGLFRLESDEDIFIKEELYDSLESDSDPSYVPERNIKKYQRKKVKKARAKFLKLLRNSNDKEEQPTMDTITEASNGIDLVSNVLDNQTVLFKRDFSVSDWIDFEC